MDTMGTMGSTMGTEETRGQTGWSFVSFVSIVIGVGNQVAVSPGFSSSTCTPRGATSSRSLAGVPVSAGNVP
jgi:hypothetical protein